MVVKIHAIKPNPINDEAMSKVLRDGAKDFSKDVVNDHDAVTWGWSGERPKWKVEYWANQYQIGFKVTTNEASKGGEKWVWLDKGTKAHEIRAKNANTLAFPTVFRAGSKPGSLITHKSTSGGPMAFPQVVHHPGSKARGWSEMLKEKEQPKFEQEMIPYMAKAAKASGHSMEK